MSNVFADALQALLDEGTPPDERFRFRPQLGEPETPREPTPAEIEAAQRRDNERTKRLAADLGWPLRALDAAWSPADSMAVSRIRAWSPDKNIAVLSGGPGLGKTVAVAAWMRETGTAMRFLRASTFATMSRYEQDSREQVFNARALCLDDLGAEYLDAKGSFLVDLDELIDTFYGNRRPLAITTNLTSQDFKARYGKRIEDRIRECGEWITVTGSSMRGARG